MGQQAAIYITIIGTAIVMFLSITLFKFFISYQKRKFHYIREKQQLQTTFHQELLRTQLEIQEQTFQNISQEIHDNIGQMLSLVKLNLNTTDINQPNIADQKIKASKELVAKVISDLRDLSKSLNPEIIMNVGLSEAIQRELLIVAKTGQYDANLSQNGDFYRFDIQKELIIFRIFQEIINNIIKHSGAKTVNVTLDYQPQLFILIVSDDGKGFDITSTECEEHFKGIGLHSMRNRARLIGAPLKFISAPEKGTVITLALPVSNPT